jgi:hypothetical protein
MYQTKEGFILKIFITALIVFSALSVNTFAQSGGEYTVTAIKDNYVIIGEKPYKMLTKCEGIQPEDKVSFSESPITCLKATLVNLLTLSECEVECASNESTPYEPEPETAY